MIMVRVDSSRIARRLIHFALPDGMPPLVDNPHPSMTFTFFTDMTPITALSTDPTVPFETVWEDSAPPAPVYITEPLETHSTFQGGPERTTHSKKRDASYIPRPPNAFILFRSSFIRSQQVPEKVEGNHSTLSKIIGTFLSRCLPLTYEGISRTQANTGRPCLVRNGRSGKPRHSLPRQNIGEDTLIGAFDPELTRSLSSRSRMGPRPIEDESLTMDEKGEQISTSPRRAKMRDVPSLQIYWWKEKRVWI